MRGRPKKDVAALAQAVGYHCVRNSELEDWHAEGRISDEEMKEFMIGIVDRIFTALYHVSDFEFTDGFLKAAGETLVFWQEPKLDEEFKQAFVDFTRTRRARQADGSHR